MASDVAARSYDGLDAEAIRARTGVSRVELYDTCTSTLDVAHSLAREGAGDRTLVIAEEQTAGRGRGNKSWKSARGRGVWTSFLLRPQDAEAVSVLSIRTGLYLAQQLDAIAGEPVSVKWPNDLYLHGGKVAGILMEARWRERVPEWVALGIGINVSPPGIVIGEELSPGAASLPPGAARIDVLDRCAAAVFAASQGRGALTPEERGSWEARDIAVGRRCTRPRPGIVSGIAADGALLVEDEGEVHAVYAGSLRFTEE